MTQRFKIVVPSFNSVDYIGKTLASIEAQTYPHYAVCVIDDASTLSMQRPLIADFCQRKGWISIHHETNQGALASIVEGIGALKCQDDDVIVMIDGDDWLYDACVLEKLAKIYTEEKVWLTWGQFETYPPGCIHMTYAAPVDKTVIEQKLYRQIPDVFAHLKTYKYDLFRQIHDADLRDPTTGDYFRVSWDKALLYPMLEMAGPHIRFIEDLLYVYNIDNPINDFKINREEQIAATDYIRHLPSYPEIN